MKRILIWALKAAAAGVAALLVLCALCMLYYNVPVHYTNETGTTEYRWQAGAYYRKGTEGFAFGRTNNDGFVNLNDYKQGEHIDILLMGSSHVEAMNVPLEENTAAVLNQLSGGASYCYSIGVSGHTLPYCVKHLERALELYEPEKYVVIETGTLSFPQSDIDAVLAGTLADIPSQSGGLVGLMQKLSYLRLFYTKYIKTGGEADGAAADAGVVPEAVIARIGEICREKDVTPIIAYHSPVLVDESGQPYSQAAASELAAFRAACDENGVVFADASGDFVEGFRQYCRLPYGFLNTAPGAGHMNSWGHRLYAARIYETVEELEAQP